MREIDGIHCNLTRLNFSKKISGPVVHFYGQCILQKNNFGPVVLWSSLQQIPLLGHVQSCCERNRWYSLQRSKVKLFPKNVVVQWYTSTGSLFCKKNKSGPVVHLETESRGYAVVS